MAATKPRHRDDLTIYDVDGEVLVYDPSSRAVHHLNPTAGLVLRLLDGTATLKQTSLELAEAYGEPADRLERNVRDLVKQFREAGLLAVKVAAEQEAAPDERRRVRMEVPRSD